MKSISKAALALHVAQPALSRQIKLLEEYLGEALFERQRKGVVLTAAGEAVLARAIAVVHAFDRLKALPKGSALCGHVRFGVPKSLMESFAAPALARFCRLHPAVSMLLIEGTTRDFQELMHAGALDLAIVSELERSPAARMQPLLREPLVLAASAASGLVMRRPVSARTVAQQVICTANRGNVIRVTLEAVLRARRLAPQIGLETNSHLAARMLAASGQFHAVLTYSGIATELAAGRVTAAPIRGADIGWNIIVTPLRDLPRQAAALRDFMDEEAQQWLARHGLH